MAKARALKLLIIVFILSLAGNFFMLIEFEKHLKADTTTRGYALLANNNFDYPQGVILHFTALKIKIKSLLSPMSDTGTVGIYLQNLYSGARIGINDEQGFVPASLLKIPIAMAIMKKYDSGEISLDDKVMITPLDIEAVAGVPERFTIGEEMSYWELIRLMLKLSDNTAKNILKGELAPEEINSVFTHVGIPNPYQEDIGEQLVSPNAYGRLFKALFYSTYLSKASSEKILELATETRAENLIAAGVPWEIQVAHKYGARPDLLHDCGIVYYPRNPYILCVMTSQIEFSKAQNLIENISEAVYIFTAEQSKPS